MEQSNYMSLRKRIKDYDQKHGQSSTIDLLNSIIELAQNQPKISIGQMFEILANRGHAIFFILFSFPFCLPIQIPGFSAPFGIMLAYLSLRIILGKKPWCPQWILKKELESINVISLIDKVIFAFKKIKRFLRPRYTVFVDQPIFHVFNGVLLLILSCLLALPIPLPMANMLPAIPIFIMGFGFLEDDGIAILIGYFFALICFSAFAGIIIFGKTLFTKALALL